MSANDFDKYINNEIKVLDEYSWINNCGSKARKKAIQNAEIAYKRFFKGQAKFPKFKKKNKCDVKLYFPKNNKGDWKVDRHKIMIPTLKNVRLKEYGYIPIGIMAYLLMVVWLFVPIFLSRLFVLRTRVYDSASPF